MGKRITVQVTQDDIEWGKAGDSHRCMVARALARVIPGAVNVEVDTASIRYSTPEGRFWWATPLQAMQYVSDFDLGVPRGEEMIPGEQLGPFSFTLRDVIRRPSKHLTPKGREKMAQRTKGLAAIREDHGLTLSQWRALTSAERKQRTEESRERGIGPVPAMRQAPRPPLLAPIQEGEEGEDGRTVYTIPGRKAPPRVFRTSKRAYGNRLLRWNQESPDPMAPARR